MKRGKSTWNKGKHLKESTKRILSDKATKRWVRGVYGEESRYKMGKPNRGKKLKLITRIKIAKTHINEKNINWRGEKAKYSALHNWVKRRFPKTKLCQDCNEPARDLANISQEYKRDLDDWEWLCRKCHMIKDGRMGKIQKLRKKWISEFREFSYLNRMEKNV